MAFSHIPLLMESKFFNWLKLLLRYKSPVQDLKRVTVFSYVPNSCWILLSVSLRKVQEGKKTTVLDYITWKFIYSRGILSWIFRAIFFLIHKHFWMTRKEDFVTKPASQVTDKSMNVWRVGSFIFFHYRCWVSVSEVQCWIKEIQLLIWL